MKKNLNEIIQIMDSIYRIDVSMYAEFFMQQAINNRRQIVGDKSIQSYIINLSNNRIEALNFKEALINNYTDFFRDQIIYTSLENWILPNLIKDKSEKVELRIWSAGCSSGQEPYSIAMLIDECLSKFNSSRYRIIATDISELELSVAEKGEYEESLIQNLKVKYINKYFKKNGATYSVISKLKDRICFSVYDMLDKNSLHPQESIFGNFDIVFCNNLLIYYRPEHQKYILNKLINSISDNGYLIIGEAEINMIDSFKELKPLYRSTSFFQKKRGELCN